MGSYGGEVLASHNNCRSLVPGDRQLSDEQVLAIVGRDGVIGVAMDNWMLSPDYQRGQSPRELVHLSDVADHIDAICQLAGNCRHVAIGSDLDGGYGREQTPVGLDTIAGLQSLGGILAERGYGDEDLDAAFHGNLLRLLRRGLPK
jgi:membrane dipeptidase